MSLSYRAPRGRARTLAPAKPALTVILYGLTSEATHECSLAAAELGVARTEVKHLQAACTALMAHPKAMLVASSRIRPWDREVVEDHARRAGAPVRWVTSDADAYDAANAVSAWSTLELRRARTLR